MHSDGSIRIASRGCEAPPLQAGHVHLGDSQLFPRLLLTQVVKKGHADDVPFPFRQHLKGFLQHHLLVDVLKTLIQTSHQIQQRHLAAVAVGLDGCVHGDGVVAATHFHRFQHFFRSDTQIFGDLFDLG